MSIKKQLTPSVFKKESETLSLSDIARKYGGRAEFSADGTQFRASVFLSCPAGAASETDDTAGQPQSAP